MLAFSIMQPYIPILKRLHQRGEPVPVQRILNDLRKSIPESTVHRRIQRLKQGPRPAVEQVPCPPRTYTQVRKRECLKLSRAMHKLLEIQETRILLGIERPRQTP